MNEIDKIKQSVPFVWPLPEVFRYPKENLSNDLELLLKRFPFDNSNQIMLTSDRSTNQNPYEYVGSLFCKLSNKYLRKEYEFKYFIEAFKDLIFYRIYQELSAVSPFQIGRVRLMKLNPKSCYSMHKDDGIRYHVPLKTNEQAFLLFKENGAFQIPADGRVYGTNTMLEHTAMNGGDEDRIHLVFSTTWDFEKSHNLQKILNS